MPDVKPLAVLNVLDGDASEQRYREIIEGGRSVTVVLGELLVTYIAALVHLRAGRVTEQLRERFVKVDELFSAVSTSLVFILINICHFKLYQI